MLFDEQQQYFDRRHRELPYQQGDIVLVPTGILEPHVPPASEAAAVQPVVEIRRQLWQAGSGRHGDRVIDIDAVDVVGAFLPAMIMTHDCTMEKEFNRAVEQMRGGGLAIAKAREVAGDDPKLDRLWNVAPLVPYSNAAPSGEIELKRNAVLGYFPVCPSPDHGIDEGVIDFNRVCTVDKNSVVGRLASLSDDARSALRFALARYWVFRAPHIGIELEAAVERRIKYVGVSEKDPLLIDIELSDGSTMQLIQPPEPPTTGGIERAAAT